MPTELETAVEEQDGRVRFVIKTGNALYQERLAHMGYLPVGVDRLATRWFRPARTPRYYERFATSIETMVLQSARLLAVPWKAALRDFLGRVQGSGLTWWLYGSAALAIRGIEIEPGDIDVNASDCALAGRILDDLLVMPVERMNSWVARCGGRAFSHAIIEWLSEPIAELDDPA